MIILIFLFFISFANAQTYIRNPALIQGVTSTVTATGTTTLTSASQTNQIFTGTNSQSIVLPDATTIDIGRQFNIYNLSSSTLTLKNNGGSTLITILPNANMSVVSTSNSTTNGLWDNSQVVVDLSSGTFVKNILSVINGGSGASSEAAHGVLLGQGSSPFTTVAVGATNTVLHGNTSADPTYSAIVNGDITNGTIDLTTKVTGTLPINNGGTNQSGTATSGGIWYGTGTAFAITAAGSSGQLLSSAGAGTPIWTSSTYPSSGTSGGLLYFSSATTISSSSSFPANQILLGGGAGASPTNLGSLGTTTTVLHGNAAGAPTFGAVSLTTDVSGVLPIANGGTNNGSLAVTAGGVVSTDGSKLVNTGAGSSGQVLQSAGSGTPTWRTITAPTSQKYISGSGTYTTPTNPSPLYIQVIMVGGGGGGAGSGANATPGTGGNNGGNSTFGTTLLVANGGTGGGATGAGGDPGTASLGTGPIGTAVTGSWGDTSSESAITTGGLSGGHGGDSCLGGGGAGSNPAGTSTSAKSGATNSGSGGGGAGPNASTLSFAGGGGGSGGCINAIITSPLSSYSYAVGGAGTHGNAGTGGSNGADGGAGYIEVREFYQ